MKNCVATGHPLCTRIALETLERGGNAFDAAVAAGFMASLAEPLLTSLGGGGYMMTKTADSMPRLYDFFVNIPGIGQPVCSPKTMPIDVQFVASTQVFHIGPGSVAVPGTLKGFLQVADELGTQSLESIVAPVVKLAREGIRVDKNQAYVLKILNPIMLQCDEGRSIYEKDGRLLREGDTLGNPLYGDFLENLSRDGADSFYFGAIAEKICADLSSESQIHMQDLRDYRVETRAPIQMEYHGRTIFLPGAPALGGEMVAQMLQIAIRENLNQAKWGGADHLGRLFHALEVVETTGEQNTLVATRGTTHISVADKFGNVASLSLTNGEGSGYFVPGTGVMLNNMLGEDDIFPPDPRHLVAGSRIGSMMAPAIVTGNGPTIAMGSGGSKRIRSSIMQVLSNLIDFDMSLEEAIHAPRINFDGTVMQVEPGFDEDAMAGFSNRYKLNVWPDLAFYFGGVHSVVLGQSAYGDPRRGGAGEASL